MPSLKSLKLRIKSIKSTRKITKAMQMVSAAKLKRARDQAESAKAYTDRMKELMLSITSGVENDPSDEKLQLLFGNGFDNKVLILCVSSDRGLCGSFNMNIVKTVRKRVAELESQNKEVSIICIGKKCYDVLKAKFGKKIVANYSNDAKPAELYHFVASVIRDVLVKFEEKAFDVCEVIFNEFISVVNQTPKLNKLIPFDASTVNDIACKTSSSLEFEPSEQEIIHTLLPKNLCVGLYKAILDSRAGEYASRMAAMDNATRNSSDMIDNLNLIYNRTRQAHITKELIEIISGAEAV
jgi:F-type H+-transporting ATPase subunit gamma